MSESGSLLGPGGIVVLMLYLSGLLLIGWVGRRAKKENTLADHFLAGRNLGLVVLFFTLYATQYSGNTLIGFAGNAYRRGFIMMMSVTAMMAVVAIILLYAPRLQVLSRKHDYITPSDFILDRYQSPLLALMISLLGIWAMANYILSNLIAIGTIVETSTGGTIPFAVGVIGLSLVMVVYESLGGMRSVAWTDLMQGAILMVGIGLLFVLVFTLYDGPLTIARELNLSRPDLFAAPSWEEKRGWLSTIILLAFGIAIYPHLVQRFFAARDQRALRRSLQSMVFMPFITTLLVVLVAIVGLWRFPELSRADSERILLLVINDMASHIPLLSIMLVLFVSASVAAIMSTVDSALLTLSSLFTQDLYKPATKRTDQAHLTTVGKAFSWGVMALMAWLAIILPNTIWWLIQLKLAYFVQAAPAILLGVGKGARQDAVPVLAGLFAGLGIVLLHTILVQSGVAIPAKPWGIHAGVWGLGVNVLVVAGMKAVR
ncbi:sodium:solute symporter family protein [bacterium]|nr:sodium:solute symporter family protein [bacterium]